MIFRKTSDTYFDLFENIANCFICLCSFSIKSMALILFLGYQHKSTRITNKQHWLHWMTFYFSYHEAKCVYCLFLGFQSTSPKAKQHFIRIQYIFSRYYPIFFFLFSCLSCSFFDCFCLCGCAVYPVQGADAANMKTMWIEY